MQRAPLLAIALSAVWGCGALDRCGTWRSLDLYAVPDTVQTGTVDARFSLLDSRDQDNDQFVWWIGFTPGDLSDSTVASSHLHHAETGDVVFTFPVDQWRPDTNVPSWEVSTFQSSAYADGMPMESFFALLRSGAVYVDVHTAAHADGIRAQVVIGTFQDWTTVCD